MSASTLPPTAPTTLAIVLGASAWPNSSGFQASRAFTHAARGFRNYLLDPRSFGLPAANLLDLFDAPSGASDQLEQLGSFLEERTQALTATNQPVRDVLVYFVGHGGFAGPSADFYLMPRRTNASSLRATGMAIDALAEVMREKARQTRRYLFLDCCFAAAAFRAFQGGPDQTAITKTLDAFGVQARSGGHPRKGMVLLCSSDQKSPSLLLPDESCTMFSHALLDVLRNGDLHRPLQLSLRDIKELAEDQLAALPEKNAPRPGLYSPDQSEGDVADVPLFPNVRAEEERRRRAEEAERVRLAAEIRVQNIKEQVPPMLNQTFLPPTSPHAAIPPQGSFLRSPIVSPQVANSSQSSATLPLPPTSRPKRPSSLYLAIVLVLVLLLGGSLGIYEAATGHLPFSPNANTQINTRVLSQTWHIQHSGTSQPLSNVAWSGSLFVVVGGGVVDYNSGLYTSTILTSSNGTSWTGQNFSANAELSDVVWSSSLSLFVAVGQSTILTSPNGTNWTAHNYGTSHPLSGVVWSGSQFVAVGGDVWSGGVLILTSPNGNTWTVQHLGADPRLSKVELSDVVWSSSLSLFVAVGSNGTILTSPNGRTWTTRNSGTSQTLHGIAWSGYQFVVVGDGTILSSPNGISWTAHNSDPSRILRDVAWSSSLSLFVVVGNESTILSSPNGISWTTQNAGTDAYLSGVAWAGSRFVVVGDPGTILISP